MLLNTLALACIRYVVARIVHIDANGAQNTSIRRDADLTSSVQACHATKWLPQRRAMYDYPRLSTTDSPTGGLDNCHVCKMRTLDQVKTHARTQWTPLVALSACAVICSALEGASRSY